MLSITNKEINETGTYTALFLTAAYGEEISSLGVQMNSVFLTQAGIATTIIGMGTLVYAGRELVKSKNPKPTIGALAGLGLSMV